MTWGLPVEFPVDDWDNCKQVVGTLEEGEGGRLMTTQIIEGACYDSRGSLDP